MQFQSTALLVTEIKVKLILLYVVAGLIWKSIGMLYSGAVFHTLPDLIGLIILTSIHLGT